MRALVARKESKRRMSCAAWAGIAGWAKAPLRRAHHLMDR
jgi:hypothetical protein